MVDLQLCECHATSIADVDEKLLMNILSRLSTRSLLICQCVCKRFNDVIKKPTFIATHVRHASTFNTSFCSVFLLGRDENCKDRYDHILLENTNNSVASFSHVRLWNPISGRISIVGSCNGLFCADVRARKQNESFILLWNPITRKNRYLPRPPCDASVRRHTLAHAFGFTLEPSDYKVVKIFTYDDHAVYIEVYKMSIDAWITYEATTLPCHEPDHLPPEVNPILLLDIDGADSARFLKGTFHWLAGAPGNLNRTTRSIVSFSLKEEQLELFTVLDPHKIADVQLGMLDVLYDSLSLIIPHYWSPNAGFDIWVMNEYGNRESWTKQFTVEEFSGFARPVGYWKNDLFIMARIIFEDRNLFFYNLKTQEKITFPGMRSFLHATFCDYVETLEKVSREIAVVEGAVQ